MNNKQVITIITQGRAYKSGSFLLKMAENKDLIDRNISILTPKKQFKTAILRNKARRLLKSAINTVVGSKNKLNKGYLYVFTVNSSILSSSFDHLVNELKIFAVKNGIL